MISILMSAALAQVTTNVQPAPNAPVQVVAPQEPRRICRIERDTSSHIQARRICQTVQEREQERDQAQRTMAENTARDWERRQVDRLNEIQQTSWLPNGISGIAPTRGPR